MEFTKENIRFYNFMRCKPSKSMKLCRLSVGNVPVLIKLFAIGQRNSMKKRLNRMWVDGQGERPVMLRQGFQNRKRMFTVFFNYSGPLVVGILPQDTTMTATYHAQDVFSQVKSAINEQRPKVSTSRTLCLHDNAGPHKARATTQSLRELGIQVSPPHLTSRLSIM
ncbi:transposase [Elysia marginata]|uniref:Transposase n=1 Tax=Elysia marginata TaxID=1093978 RepID=A0AAV4EXE1_9GAST|nr:transposase [Elysia marginata]